VATTRDGLERIPGAAAASRIIIEVGAQSPWISRYLKELGFEVIVANARKVAMISKRSRKNDRIDAQTLAPGRIDTKSVRSTRSAPEMRFSELNSRPVDAAVYTSPGTSRHLGAAELRKIASLS